MYIVLLESLLLFSFALLLLFLNLSVSVVFASVANTLTASVGDLSRGIVWDS